ncbi:MAG: hypothetical protein Q9166_001459 [cf. Caloplaca sp. 2 TL-2023]
MAVFPRCTTPSGTNEQGFGIGASPLRSNLETDEYWISNITEEPVSDDLKELIRADLEKTWHFRRDEEHRWNTKITWVRTDSNKILLAGPVDKLKPQEIESVFNQPTACYWLESAQRVDSTGQRTIIPSIIFATLYEEWYRFHKGKPNIEHGHFFANPIRVAPTGPSLIRGIIDAHISLYTRASNLQGQKASTFSERYSLLPSYNAIVLIIDRLDYDEIAAIEQDGYVSLRKLARTQTILIARTGMEERLSEPISFESLTTCSLPLERPDITEDAIDIVRVSLDVAVHFVSSLEIREKSAMPKSEAEPALDTRLCPGAPKGFERNVCYHPKTWADAQLVSAEKHGYEDIPETWQSIRRVKAGQVGEGFCELRSLPFGIRWK